MNLATIHSDSSRVPTRRLTATLLSEPLTAERVGALRQGLGRAMDAIVALGRPNADRAMMIEQASAAVTAFVDDVREAAGPPRLCEHDTQAVDLRELWVCADRALVEAYSRALCGNTIATQTALAKSLRAAEALSHALRRTDGGFPLGDDAAETEQ